MTHTGDAATAHSRDGRTFRFSAPPSMALGPGEIVAGRLDDGQTVVLRPLCYVPEQWLAEYCRRRGFPVTTCSTLACGAVDSSRQQMKQLISGLAAEHPGIRWQALRALQNVRSEHLLDRRLLGENLVPRSGGFGD